MRFAPTNRRLLSFVVAIAATFGAPSAEAQSDGETVRSRYADAVDSPVAPPDFDATNDLAPILRRRCLACHATGGVAGLPLDTPTAIVENAARMRDAVSAGRMPPWRPLGPPGEFANDRALAPREKVAFDDWAKAARKDAAIEPFAALSDGVRHWRLGRPDAIEPVEPRTRSFDADGVMTALVELKDRRSRRLRGVELRSTSGAPFQTAWVVLDAPVSRPIPSTTASPSRAASVSWPVALASRFNWFKRPGEERPLQERAARLLATRDVQPLALLSADAPYAATPPWSAWEVPAGSKLEIAWRPAIASATAIAGQELEVALHYTEDETPRRLWTVTLAGAPRSDIAGRTVRDEFTTPVPVEALAIAVHGSWRTREVHLDSTSANGKSESLLWIDRYDPRWETSYTYFRPRRFGAGDRIEFRAHEATGRERRNSTERLDFPLPLGDAFACVTLACKRAEDEPALERALFGKRLESGRTDR